MGACRETYDLFRRAGWHHLRNDWNRSRFRWTSWALVLEDTLGRVVCAVVGHESYDVSDPGGDAAIACRRCHKWLPGGEK